MLPEILFSASTQKNNLKKNPKVNLLMLMPYNLFSQLFSEIVF